MKTKATAVFFSTVCAASLFLVSSNGVFGKNDAPIDAKRKFIQTVIFDKATGLSLKEEMKLVDLIMEESRENGIDPLLILALIETESSYRNWVKSRKGAVGLMQLHPDTAREIAEEMSLRYEGEKTLYDPYKNVKMGVYYLSSLKEEFNDTEVALAAYNNGPSRLRGKIRDGETLPGRYKTRVYTKYREMKERVM